MSQINKLSKLILLLYIYYGFQMYIIGKNQYNAVLLPKKPEMSFPELSVGGCCSHSSSSSSWNWRFGAAQNWVVGGLQECFNVGSTEEKVELKTKKQPSFFQERQNPFAFMSLSLASGSFIKPSNHLNKYSYGCSTSH